jgi:hypothetical protein
VYDLDVFRQTAKQTAEGGFQIEGLLTDEQVERLRAEGYEVEVGADADQLAADRRRELHGGRGAADAE